LEAYGESQAKGGSMAKKNWTLIRPSGKKYTGFQQWKRFYGKDERFILFKVVPFTRRKKKKH
jgi:hypothetical protein